MLMEYKCRYKYVHEDKSKSIYPIEYKVHTHATVYNYNQAVG